MAINSIKLRVLLVCILVGLCVPLYSQHTISHGGKKQQTTLQKKRPSKSREVILKNLRHNMVYIEGGTFLMGDSSRYIYDGISEAKFTPQHVKVSSFYICRYEVTQEEWQVVMGTNPSKFKGNKKPVENVSWYDCQTFIQKLNEITDMKFRLPTEAEWEYAASGGQKRMVTPMQAVTISI